MSCGLKLVLLLILAALPLSACGKRGALEAPTTDSVADAKYDKTKGKGKGEEVQGLVTPRPKDKMYYPKPDDKPHRDFVLDPLLR
jgi:predicted small lipoprotein YifL